MTLRYFFWTVVLIVGTYAGGLAIGIRAGVKAAKSGADVSELTRAYWAEIIDLTEDVNGWVYLCKVSDPEGMSKLEMKRLPRDIPRYEEEK